MVAFGNVKCLNMVAHAESCFDASIVLSFFSGYLSMRNGPVTHHVETLES